MSDFLESVRQAIERVDGAQLGGESLDDEPEYRAVETVTNAARRYVRLAETGPDYEAAKTTLHEILREAGVSVVVNSDLVVDAAVPWLSDYTKEERNG